MTLRTSGLDHEGNSMERDAGPVSVTPAQVARLLHRGLDAEDIVRLLVATGSWTEAGATEIVSTLAQGPTATGIDLMSADEPGWPGSLEEVPSLFAT